MLGCLGGSKNIPPPKVVPKKTYLYPMIEAFKSSPVLLLFVVSAIGYWIGNIPIRGAKLE